MTVKYNPQQVKDVTVPTYNHAHVDNNKMLTLIYGTYTD